MREVLEAYARRFTVLVICPMTITVVVSPAQAQATDVAAAQAIGAAFLKAKEAGDWKAAAGFLDLEPLERERQMVVSMARQERATPPMTASGSCKWTQTCPVPLPSTKSGV